MRIAFSTQTISLMFLSAAVAAAMSACAAARANTLPFNKVVVFGDSLSDVGNLAAATANSATHYPAPPPAYAPGEYTDGADTTPSTNILGVWVQQLNNNFLNFSPLKASLLGGTDYAYADAVTGTYGTGVGSQIPGMQTQVNTFLTGSPAAPANALYTFLGGANDIAQAAASNPFTIDTAAATAAINIDHEIQQIYNAGGRDFMWVNLPPLNLTPAAIAAGTLAQAAAASATATFNSAWQSDITSLQAANPGIHIIGENAYALTNTVVANPAKYGFTNTTTPAQGLSNVNPNHYFFWDTTHPTTAADQLLASQAFHDINTTFVPEPSAILLLAVGACCTVPLRRRRRSVA